MGCHAVINGEEPFRAPTGSFQTFCTPIDAAAGPAAFASFRRWEVLEVRRAAPLASGRHPGVRNEDYIVAVFAREILDPGPGAVLDLLPSPLADRVTAVDDICRDLRDVGEVLS